MKKNPILLLSATLFGALVLCGMIFLHALKAPGDVAKKNDAVTTENSVNENVKMVFVGDMMFDRWIRQVSDKKGGDYVFQGVAGVLQGGDVVVGNLEGPITKNASISVASEMGSRENFVFTFPLGTAENIYNANIRLVNIGNNHIFNFGKNGLDETKEYLHAASVDYFGDVEQNDERYSIKDVKGIKIAFVNFNQFTKNAEQNTLNDLKIVEKLHPDIIVVYTHWGIEYKNEPDEHIKTLARQFIDYGADLIIGSHPHVVQTKEEYKGKMIYYSLGNFIFDQYFDTHTQEGLIIEASIDPMSKKISTREHRIILKNNGQTVLNDVGQM